MIRSYLLIATLLLTAAHSYAMQDQNQSPIPRTPARMRANQNQSPTRSPMKVDWEPYTPMQIDQIAQQTPPTHRQQQNNNLVQRCYHNIQRQPTRARQESPERDNEALPVNRVLFQ